MLTIIGAIRGTARENQELVSRTSLECLEDRIWQRRLYYLHKILPAELPPPPTFMIQHRHYRGQS